MLSSTSRWCNCSKVVLRPRRAASVLNNTGLLTSRSFHFKLRSEPPLSEFFNRVPWPTTMAEKKRLADVVRTEIWDATNGDKRERLERENEAKRRRVENGEAGALPIYATQFSPEEIANEERRPKKKVALLLGYSGTGYSGMQLNSDRKTIEGDLFAALVSAGAISKANASDPKKSSFVRCARTDKGVHAAGNVVSLKMIVEDEDIIKKVNGFLSPQIRLWGYELTTSSFSCYNLCDSRIYEYLMPSHCLLPPHPSTFMGRKIVEYAKKEGDLETVLSRQEEVAGYWEQVDEEYIKPILEKLPEDIREVVEQSLFAKEEEEAVSKNGNDEPAPKAEAEAPAPKETSDVSTDAEPFVMDPRQKLIVDTIKAIKAAYASARRTYRAPPPRIARLQECLDQYVGTRNFHNYTIQKTFKDPSAKRQIKSFKVNPTPIVINGTEWLSLKVHGQSFMMHQIRKMVAMAVMITRSGCTHTRISESYSSDRVAIPKAPSLGLLLERPIFDSYNAKAATLERQPVAFDKFTKEMEEFKQREIYDRIFREEEQTSAFGNFFNHIDHYPAGYFLYVTSGGLQATKQANVAPAGADRRPGDESKPISKDKGKSQNDALAAVEAESDDEENPTEDS